MKTVLKYLLVEFQKTLPGGQCVLISGRLYEVIVRIEESSSLRFGRLVSSTWNLQTLLCTSTSGRFFVVRISLDGRGFSNTASSKRGNLLFPCWSCLWQNSCASPSRQLDM